MRQVNSRLSEVSSSGSDAGSAATAVMLAADTFTAHSFASSYLLGNDTLHGWGPRYFFTFYSEFGARHGVATAEAVFLLAVFAASVVANVSVAAAVLRYREMRTVTNCFLLNLSVADILFAVGIPAIAVARVRPHWQLGNVVCKLLPYSQFVCGFVLLWTLTLISMDRHHCIVKPPYRSQLTPRLAAFLTAATWALAAVLFLPVVFWFYEEPTLHICTLVFPKTNSVSLSVCFTLPAIFFTCVLPMALLVYHYQRIFQKLLKTRRRWSPSANVSQLDMSEKTVRKFSLQHVVQPARQSSISQHDEFRLRKHIRVVRILLLNVLVVLIMWLPITVVMFLIYVDGKRPTEDTGFFLRSHHFIWALLVAYLNTLINPILYGLLSENFRVCFSRLWFLSRRRRQACRTALGEDRHPTPSVGRSQEVSQGQADKRSRHCYHTGCNENVNGRQKNSLSTRQHDAFPGSANSMVDSPSTAAIIKL